MRKLGEFFHGPERHDPLQAARRFARRVQLENPPGRRELRFRVATMQDFEQWMLDILSHRLSFMASRLPPGSAEEDGIHGSAIRHNPQTGNNWMLALVHAWSSVADILTFYQERYLQERFYGTARERRVSVYELAQSIGYVPRPAIAGSAHVAFEATDVPGLPKTFRLPAGAELQSRPAAGEVAMRFETEEVLEARAEWNRLGRPGLLVLPQEVRGAAVELCLAGSSTGLAPGAALLVHGVINGASRALLRPLTEVEVLPAEADEIGELAETRTRVAWNRPLAEEVSEASFDPSTVEVFALRQAVSLFGAEAARWLDLPFELRRGIQEAAGQSLLGGILVGDAESWQPINLGLPLDAEPTALAVDEEDTLYVGTRGRGLYRRLGSARSWEPGNRGVQLLEIECLHTDPRLGVLAGTADGNLYRSTDRGEIWAPLSGRSMGARLGGVVGLLGLGGQTGTLAGRRRLDRLPSIPVRALTTVSRGSVTEILLGTDSGFFLSTDLANSWYPQNKGLPGVDSETGESEVAVRGVARAEGDEIFAATSHGVFRSADGGGQWRAASAGLPDHDPELDTAGPVQALAALADRRRRRTLVLAATERGLYRSLDGGASWNAVRKTPAGNTEIAIHAVAALNDSITVTARFFAATEGGLWSSEDDGETFHAVDLSQAVPPDRADRAELTVLAVDERNGRVLTASPDYGFAENEWPKFHLAADHIDLSREVTGLPAGDLDALASWIVLEPTVDEATLNPDAAGLGVYRIRATATVQRRDFGLDARLTRLFVQRDPRFAEAPPLAAYGLRTTRAWVLSEPLALAKIRRIDLEGLRERIFGSLRELQQMDPRRQLVVQIRRSAPGLGFSREPIYVCFPIDQPMSRAL